MSEPITPITPRKLMTPANDISTGIFDDILVSTISRMHLEAFKLQSILINYSTVTKNSPL
jgi:hypothetical protein